MKHVLSLALCFVCFHAAASRAVAAVDASGLTSQERQREITLRNRLCANRNVRCEYVDSIFSDPRLTVYPPPEPAPPPSPATQKTRQRNPYLTERFGLLTPTSLERCRSFIAAHSLAFDAALTLYGVTREVICGHLRLETDFGIPTTTHATSSRQHPCGQPPGLALRAPAVALASRVDLRSPPGICRQSVRLALRSRGRE